MLVEILLKTSKRPPDGFRVAQVGHGIGDGVVIFQAEQRGELFLVEFFHAHGDIVLEDEVQEGLLLVAKVTADAALSVGGSFAPRDGRACIGDVGEHVE